MERDRLSLKQYRAEEAAREEAERIEREAPLREAEQKLAASTLALNKRMKEVVQSGRDPDFQIPASVAGKGMTVEEASTFNASEGRKFSQNTPEFYPSARNIDAILDYLVRQGINIADAATYRAAYLRLRDLGLLEERPPEPEPIEAPPEPEPVIVAEPETFAGVDPETGSPREYTQREVTRMDSLTFRKCFKLYGDNIPRCIDSRP